MKASVFINNQEIGDAELEIIDKTMGAVYGKLNVNKTYDNYRQKISEYFEKKGIANSNDFHFKILLSNGLELNPTGGIGIIDSSDDDIYVESAGNNLENWTRNKNGL